MEDIDKERDRRDWNLKEIDPCDKDVWRSSVRSACMQLASYQEGSPLMLLHLHINLNADDDDDELINKSAVEFSYSQYLKTTCNDTISIWDSVNAWKPDVKTISFHG